MSVIVEYPADITVKQIADENPYEPAPFLTESEAAIEMRNHQKFTPLPQEPPPAPSRRQKTEDETNMSTGQSVAPHSPLYKDPPPYKRRSQNGQHFYEEVNHSGLQKSSSKDSAYGSPTPSLPQSHTEDPAILLSQSSTTNSLAPLTISDTVERRPRKKVNPLYDSYKDDGVGTMEGSKRDSGSLDDRYDPKSSYFRSIMTHPFTIVFLIAIVLAVIIFSILLWMGTIPSNGLPGSTNPLVQPTNSSTSDEVAALKRQVEDQDAIINDLMAKVLQLEMAIVSPGNENTTVEVRVAQNTYKIMGLNESVEALVEDVKSVKTVAEIAYEQSSSNVLSIAGMLMRIIDLEDHTKSLNTTVTTLEQDSASLTSSVNTIRAAQETNTINIGNIKADNEQQDNQISSLDVRINNVDQSFQQTLDIYNETIYEDLATISKMQGPRGYNGSDGEDGTDLSQCTYDIVTQGSSVNDDTTSTPEITAGTNEVLTGISCSTDGGERALLKVSQLKFKCECSGSYQPSNNARYCYIHSWRCPI